MMQNANPNRRIFDPSTLRKFEQLSLIASQVRAGVIKGERRSTRRGTSIEFADYRDYVKGDDLRRVDWNIYARFERPFIKLLEEEEDLAVHFLIDTSASMNWPQEGGMDHHKFIWSMRVLGALAYLSITSGDFVTISGLRRDKSQNWGPHRGRAYALPLLNDLEKFYTRGPIDLNAALRDYALRSRRPGLCILISDMMSPEGYREGLNALQARGFEVAVIQVLSPDEVDPQLTGDLRLMDIETGEPQEVTVDEGMRQLYLERLNGWREEIGEHCLKRGIHFISVDTNMPWEELILFELRRVGVVR